MLYVVGNAMLLLLVIIELVISNVLSNKKFDFNDVVFNINSGHIMLWVIRSVELGIYHLATQYLNLHIVDQMPAIFLWIFAFVAWDFSFYWYHRIHHKYRLLWYIHVVHHEGEEFNLSLGIRNSWYSGLTTIPFFIWLALLGVPFEVYAIVSVIHYFIQFLNHNSLIKDIGILKMIFVSPGHHKVHHGKQDIYHNTNFGGTLVWWDILFNSYKDEDLDNPVEVGIRDPFRSQNIFEANNNRFLKALNISLHPSNSKVFTLPGWLLMVLTSLLFCGFLMYVHYEHLLDITLKIGLFVAIFMGINAIGGLSEGKRWGLVFWTLQALLIWPWFLNELYGLSLYFISVTSVLLFVTVIVFYYRYVGKESRSGVNID